MLRAANRNDPNGLISVTIRKLQRDTNMKLETNANELHTGFLMATDKCCEGFISLSTRNFLCWALRKCADSWDWKALPDHGIEIASEIGSLRCRLRSSVKGKLVIELRRQRLDLWCNFLLILAVIVCIVWDIQQRGVVDPIFDIDAMHSSRGFISPLLLIEFF